MPRFESTTQSGNRKYHADEWDAFYAGSVCACVYYCACVCEKCPHVHDECVCNPSDPIGAAAAAAANDLIREQTYTHAIYAITCPSIRIRIKCAIVFSDAIIRCTYIHTHTHIRAADMCVLAVASLRAEPFTGVHATITTTAAATARRATL